MQPKKEEQQMEVTRRNTERRHAFAGEVAQYCGIHDLQGLLLNKDWEPTAAVEAYELSEPLRSLRNLGKVIPLKELYVKCVFAQQAGVPFYLLFHIQGRRSVGICQFAAVREYKKLRCVSVQEKTEEEFIAWWRERKQTVQTKGYRSDLSGRIKGSYFDKVLETNDEKWGGNIDGYLVDWSSGDAEIRGIVENRFTNNCSLYDYDPNRYFKNNGGDYNTWLPLMKLSQQMNLPLILMTYSRQPGEMNLAGLTRIRSLNKDGIMYAADQSDHMIYPNENIMSDIGDINRWLQKNTTVWF